MGGPYYRVAPTYMILHLAITTVRSTFNKSLMVSTDCLQSHLLVGSLRHQGPPCAHTYHYQAVYLLPWGAIICLTRLPVGLPLQCHLAVARANPHRR